MRVYTVHRRRGDGEPDPVLVREGFAWPAFLFGGFWALWHRMWVAGAPLVAAEVALNALPGLFSAVDPAVTGVVALGGHLVLGFVADDLRRRSLARRGWVEVAVVTGPDRDAALVRYLDAAERFRLGGT